MKMLYIDNVIKRNTNPLFTQVWLEEGGQVDIVANLSEVDETMMIEDIIYHHVSINRNPFHFQNIKAYRQIMELTRREKYDIVLCNSPVGGVLGRVCGHRAKIETIVYVVHGFHFYEGAPFVNRTALKWAEYCLARMTDAIVTINEEDYTAAQRMKLRKDGRVFYLPGVGIDISAIQDLVVNRGTKRSEFGLNNEDFIVIAVGRLEKNKNVETMIRAAAKTGDNVKLLLCGEGEQRDYLEALADELGIFHRVIFAGFRNDVPQLLKMSDAYLMISYREGLSRSLMEAMAAGLPCIVSAIRGNVDLIKHGLGGYLVAANDVDGIANAIRLLVDDGHLRGDMEEWNLQKIVDYDVDVVKEHMKEVYETVISN